MTGYPKDPEELLRQAARAWREAHPAEGELAAYAEGALDRFEEVREHLEVCEDCTAQVRALETAAQEAATPTAEQDVELAWERFRGRLERTVGEPFPSADDGARSPDPGWRLWPAAAAVLGAATIAGALVAGWLGVSLDSAKEVASAAEERSAAAREELREAKGQLAAVREELAEARAKWTRASGPHTDVAILQWPTRARGRGVEEIPELTVGPEAERVVALLEDLSPEPLEAYRLVIRDGAGREVGSVEELERTPYGSFVVTFSREAFPKAERLELVLMALEDGQETVSRRYAIRLE